MQLQESAGFASSAFDAKCIAGLGTIDERMLILVDIERLMSGVDMGLAEPPVH